MGAAVLHLRGTYFAVLTFGMTELIRHSITYFEKQVTGTVGRVLTVVPERDTVYLTVLGLAVAAVLAAILIRRSRFGLAMAGIGADEQRAETLGVNTRLVKIAGFAFTAAFAGAVGAAMSVRWTYIDPATVFNPFIGFQTVLIALIGGAATLWGPLLAAVVFSLLAETLRLQMPQVYMMSLGLLLILSRALPAGRAGLDPLAAQADRERPSAGRGARADGPLRRPDRGRRGQRRVRAGRAGRHHRPERRRQDHLLQRPLGRAWRRPRASCSRSASASPARRRTASPSTASPAPSRRRASSPR